MERLTWMLAGMLRNAAGLLPPGRRQWAEAVRAEAGQVPAGWPRLRWLAGGLWVAAREGAKMMISKVVYRLGAVAVAAGHGRRADGQSPRPRSPWPGPVQPAPRDRRGRAAWRRAGSAALGQGQMPGCRRRRAVGHCRDGGSAHLLCRAAPGARDRLCGRDPRRDIVAVAGGKRVPRRWRDRRPGPARCDGPARPRERASSQSLTR